MIQNVIFDLGKVLIHYDFSSFFEKIGQSPEIRKLDEADEAIIKFESGLLSKPDFLDALQEVYQFSMPLERFEEAWCHVFSEKKEMIELAKKVSQTHRVFIFSNTDELHFPYIWNSFSSLHFFQDNLMLSYELQAVKPDQAAYEKALKKFSLKPEECAFVDDRPKNIWKANELGLQGHIHTDYRTTKNWLEQILSKKL